MDYKKIYQSIVERASTRSINGYTEKHHVVPKCIGGTNDQTNIVKLTAKEHFICHLLLCEIYPNNKKLVHAVWMMSNTKSYKHKRNYRVSSRTYERFRELHAKYLSEFFSGSKNPMHGKTGHFTVNNKGAKNPMYGKLGENNPNYGKKFPKHSERMKQDNPMFNPTTVEKVRLAVSKPRPKSRVPKPKKTCPNCGLIGGVNNMNRYHFDNCKNKK